MEVQERYEIRRKLGQGGVGAVYEGWDTQLGRKVAIKRLLSEDEDQSEEKVEELLRECHSLSALNSPNIVSLFDFGQDSDGPFVVMELLEGETLEEIINRAPFTEQDFLVLAEQSLEGILAAHEEHLLHRDLKPCNFMMTWLPSGRMQIKVLDFGLAKFAVEPTKQTIAHGNALFGSIYFMAPEQFEQLPLDARTDLYSLGAVFYYALTGAYPFDGDSVAQVMAGHLTGRYKDLREYRPDIKPALCNWVMSLMSRDPDDRPDSAAVALEQFSGVLQGTFDPAPPEQTIEVTSPVNLQATSDLRPNPTSQVNLQLPGSQTHTGPVSLKTDSHSLPGQTPTGSVNPWNQSDNKIFSQKEKDSFPKWIIFVGVGLAAVVLIAILASLGGKDDPKDTEITTDAKKPQEKEIVRLSGAEMRRKLSLPAGVNALLARRDKDQDGELTIEEFASFAPTTRQRKLLEEYFPIIDRNGDGRLSNNELNLAYRYRG